MKRNSDIAVEKINKMFVLSATVEFSSSWDYRIKNGDNLSKDDFKDPDMSFGNGGENGKNSDSETSENSDGSDTPVEENKEDKTE